MFVIFVKAAIEPVFALARDGLSVEPIYKPFDLDSFSLTVRKAIKSRCPDLQSLHSMSSRRITFFSISVQELSNTSLKYSECSMSNALWIK